MKIGFAAGCEAGHCPAVKLGREFGLCPPYELELLGYRRAEPDRRAQPQILKGTSTAGHCPASHPAAKPNGYTCGFSNLITAKAAPCGSVITAIRPTPGTSITGAQDLPPNSVAR